MSFFDKKEEVLDIQLTQYGKQMLSRGKFKPDHYAFFDDDILYDSEYGGQEEEQNTAERRIRDALRFHTQHNYAGIDTETFKSVDMRGANASSSVEYQSIRDREFAYSLPLGTSNPSSDYLPALSVKFMSGEITGSVQYTTGSSPSLRTPQLESSLDFFTYTRQIDSNTSATQGDQPFGHDFEGERAESFNQTYETEPFADGTYIEVDGGYLLLDISELNSLFENENFTVEVFLVEEKDVGGQTVDDLTPLFFKEGDVDEDFDEDSFDIDEKYVDYYLDVSIDAEIDERIMCNHIEKDETKGVFIKSDFDCREEDNDVITIEQAYDPQPPGEGEGEIC